MLIAFFILLISLPKPAFTFIMLCHSMPSEWACLVHSLGVAQTHAFPYILVLIPPLSLSSALILDDLTSIHVLNSDCCMGDAKAVICSLDFSSNHQTYVFISLLVSFLLVGLLILNLICPNWAPASKLSSNLCLTKLETWLILGVSLPLIPYFQGFPSLVDSVSKSSLKSVFSNSISMVIIETFSTKITEHLLRVRHWAKGTK